MPDHYAVMGNPVAHSLSPLIHELFARQTGVRLIYDKIQIDEDRFEQQVMDFFNGGGKGLNITLPCKQRAFSLSDIATPRCKQAGAANTLWMKAGKLQADNTDGVGLLRDLNRFITLDNKTILLLGAGGAARGIIAQLLAAKPKSLTIANRTLDNAKRLQQDFVQANYCDFHSLTDSFDVVINSTSAGFETQGLDFPEAMLANTPFCYDLMYQLNGPTVFVNWAQLRGCKAVDGLGMLVEQAAEAFFIWHGVMPDAAAVLAYLHSKRT